jgi:hypothetical protein
MKRKKNLGLTVLAISLAGCGNSSGGDSTFRHLSVLNDHQIAVHAPDRADAMLTSAGDLAIDGKSVTLNSAQRQITARYFANAMALRKDAIATGAAGVETAARAIDSVASGLARGNPDKIGANVDASAAKVATAANKVCGDLQALVTAQNALEASLAEFKPYASIDAQSAIDCRTD